MNVTPRRSTLETTGPRIAIVGAGPAGLLCALDLKDRGFKNVTVFGLPEESQTRTRVVDGVPADVGACYLHCGYWNTVAPLVRRFGLHLHFMGQPTLLTDNGAPLQVSRRERRVAAMAMARFFLSVVNYRLRHRGEGSRRYGVRFDEFLRARNLGVLGNSFIFGAGSVAQGFGFWPNVSAYSALRWLSPLLFLTPLMNRFNRGTASIQEGYGTLFGKIEAELNVVRTKVSAVMPMAAGGVAVTLQDGETLKFDQAVVACAGAITSPISPLLAGATTRTRFFSFLWTSPIRLPRRDRVYLMNHARNEAQDVIVSYRRYGQTRGGDQVYWGVGYLSDGMDKESLEPLLQRQIETELGLSVAQVHFHEIFDYNRRFTVDAVRSGIPAEIAARQGKDGIWYSGGLLSHWDINSISQFNRRLVRALHRTTLPRSPLRTLGYRLRDGVALLEEL